jgi:c-di-GMP-binding flagellar brake protein YcgR
VKKPNVTRDTSTLIHHVQVGQYVSVEIANIHRDRFSTRLIGMLDPKYLILELPSIVKRGELMDRLILNNTLIVRTICERTTGECLGFETKVEAIVKHPYPLFFAYFPLQMFTYELRREERLETLLPAKLYKDDGSHTVSGTITDISNGGCRLMLENAALLDGFNTQTLHLSYPNPAQGTDTVRFVRVCSRRKHGKKSLAVGLEFIEALAKTA